MLETLMKDSPFGLFVTNEYGLLEYINNEAARILGFNNADEARNFSLLNIEMTINCGLSEKFNKILGGEAFQKIEHRCTNRLGHFAYLNITCYPYFEETGHVTGILGIIQDVTESCQRKVKLEEANYVLSVISQVSEALASAAALDDVLRIILTGVTANQGLGFNRAFLFLINDDETCFEGKIAIGPNNPEEAHEIWARLAGRHRTLLELLDDYRENEKNNSFSTSLRISDWKISLDCPTVFSESMDKACGLYVARDENLTRESLEIMNRLQSDNLAVAPIIGRGKKLGIIAADNKITGKIITETRVKLLQIFANHSAVAIEHAKLYDNILERATELENINKQLAESQEQIIRAEKMSVIGELTSSIAHELRNPLMVIGGFANLMISSGIAGDDSEYLNIILSETQRSEAVLHQVLDFSRASRTKSREIDFNALVSEAFNYFQSKIKFRQKGIKLNLTDERVTVWGNPDQLLHVLLQFMHLSAEGINDDVRTIVATHRDNSTVKLTVSFQGSKQAEACARQILDKIFDSRNGTQRLSLIVAGETIKYHGGNYGVENSTDNNPKLYVELPYMRGSEK
jgi:PAS domain S-box-containing protein